MRMFSKFFLTELLRRLYFVCVLYEDESFHLSLSEMRVLIQEQRVWYGLFTDVLYKIKGD